MSRPQCKSPSPSYHPSSVRCLQASGINTAFADCPPGGPSESCTVYYIISKGGFATAYYYEAPGGTVGALGPTGYNCPNPTCSYEQTGFPGSAGFSLEWTVAGHNASIYHITSHY